MNFIKRAASIWPLSIEFKPPRTISASIADSKTVSATMAETVILKLILDSGSAKLSEKLQDVVSDFKLI